MMDALSQAERLAFENQASHAVVYGQHEPVGSLDTGRTRLFVRLAEQEAPEGAEVVTTVSRKPVVSPWGDHLKKIDSLGDAVRYVVANLPQGLRLDSRAVVSRYPAKRNYYTGATEVQGIFSYDFMSTEGRNIATWIPDASVKPHAQMLMGLDGRGREYPGWQSKELHDIQCYVDAATVSTLIPSEGATEQYVVGWREAEVWLRTGGDVWANADAQDVGEERGSGFNERLARQRALLVERDMQTTAAAAEQTDPQPEARPAAAQRP